MTLEQFLNGGSEAVYKFDVEAHKKFSNAKVTCVKDFDDEKIVGVVETEDGRKHRMTVKGWKSKK